MIQEIDATFMSSLRPPDWRHIFLDVMLPAIAGMPRRFLYAQSQVRIAETACALERYRLKYGAFPSSLDLLRSEFMAAIPREALTGAPVSYHLNGPHDYALTCTTLRPVGINPSRNPAPDGKWRWKRLPEPLQ